MSRVAIIVPAYAEAARVATAIRCAQAQTHDDWELVVVDDGSPDATSAVAAGLAGDDPRVRVVRLERNAGLGAALNAGLDATSAPLVAYLPCDDTWTPDHLATLVALVDDGAVLAHAADALELAAVVHRRTGDRWVERDELETDDLDLLLWDALRDRGTFVASGLATAHVGAGDGGRPRRRRDLMRPSRDGGLNAFRRHYRVQGPLRLHTRETGLVDEAALYARFRSRAPTPPAADGLRILLAGELAYNPERVLALEERGHRLSGLWIDDPLGFMTVGPLPFGHVAEAGTDDPADAVRRVRPDVVYALLNWRAVPLALALVDRGVPVVWHFKEAPQRMAERGEWALLAELHERAAARVYSSPEERDFMEAALPGRADPARTVVLDGDLPKRERLEGSRAPKLSAADGAPHVALLGRPVGLEPEDLAALAHAGVHTHLHGVPAAFAEAAAALAPGRVHVEEPVAPDAWVARLSGYDAGWLHRRPAANGGDLRAATWDDLNLPARLPTLLAAGLPPVQQASAPGSVAAAEALLRDLGAGLVFDDLAELPALLAREARTGVLGDRAWAVREQVTFDRHADRLLDLMRAVAR